MKIINSINFWLKGLLGLVALTVALAVYADATSYTFPSATFDGNQKKVLTTLLNTKADKAGSTNTGEEVFADGKGNTYTTNGTAPRAGIVTMVGGTSQVISTTALVPKSIVIASWQATNGTSFFSTLALKSRIDNTNFVIAAYSNATINASCAGPVGWEIINTGP